MLVTVCCGINEIMLIELNETFNTYKGYPINFEPECVAQHGATWWTYKVHIHLEWFKTSRKSVEQALYGEEHTRYGLSGKV